MFAIAAIVPGAALSPRGVTGNLPTGTATGGNVNGGRRPRWRRLAIAVAAVTAVPMVWAPGGAGAAPAPFVVQGSVEQVAVTHATPGAGIALDDRHGAEVATGTVDAQGSILFRKIPAG